MHLRVEVTVAQFHVLWHAAIPEPLWHDPAAHTSDFAERYFVQLEQHTTHRMAELGIPRDCIGSSDHDHGIEWCSINSYEDTGVV
jgi:hypothetical protein